MHQEKKILPWMTEKSREGGKKCMSSTISSFLSPTLYSNSGHIATLVPCLVSPVVGVSNDSKKKSQ